MDLWLFQSNRGADRRRAGGADQRTHRVSDRQPARRSLLAMRGVCRGPRAGGGGGFEVEYIRAEGTPGDDDRYPRVTSCAFPRQVARPTVHLFRISTSSMPAMAGRSIPSRASSPRQVFGRGACDMKGGIAASIIAVEAFLEVDPDSPARSRSGTVHEERAGSAASRIWRGRAISRSPGRPCHHSRPLNKDRICLAIVASGGPRSRPRAKWRIARCRFSATAPCATWRLLQPSRRSCIPARPQADEDAGRARGARRSTMNFNAVHAARPRVFPACAPPTFRTPAAWSSTGVPAGGVAGRREERGHRHPDG